MPSAAPIFLMLFVGTVILICAVLQILKCQCSSIFDNIICTQRKNNSLAFSKYRIGYHLVSNCSFAIYSCSLTFFSNWCKMGHETNFPNVFLIKYYLFQVFFTKPSLDDDPVSGHLARLGPLGPGGTPRGISASAYQDQYRFVYILLNYRS